VSLSHIVNVFKKTLEHEKLVTKSINDLAQVDYSTFNFLQWYVAGQHEEEHLFQSGANKIEIIVIEEKGSFIIDQEIGKFAK